MIEMDLGALFEPKNALATSRAMDKIWRGHGQGVEDGDILNGLHGIFQTLALQTKTLEDCDLLDQIFTGTYHMLKHS